MRSFIGNKNCQRWLWYAWEPQLKRIIAHVFGSRSKKTLCKLLKLLSGFNVAFWCTDGYRAYNDALPTAKYIAGKLYTQRIERENLTLRTRLKRLNRKTLGYSKSSDMHDRSIGTFIEREYYVWSAINLLNTRPDKLLPITFNNDNNDRKKKRIIKQIRPYDEIILSPVF